jgi:hypothetical protein
MKIYQGSHHYMLFGPVQLQWRKQRGKGEKVRGRQQNLRKEAREGKEKDGRGKPDKTEGKMTAK